MLIIVAFLLLLLLPTPWNIVGFLVVIPLWILELLAWNRSMKGRARQSAPRRYSGARQL